MKKIITLSVLAFFLSFVSLVSFESVEAQTDSTCPSIAPYRCNNGSCTNDAALCDQSWGGGLNTDPGGTTTGGTTTVTPPSTNNSTFGSQCTGNIRYDAATAKACADLAEAQGKALGYNIDCSVETRSEQLSLNSSPTGETVNAYYGACTVNGVSGFYDIDLVGYTGTGAAVQRYPGKTGYDANDYIFGSNYQRSAGWNILPCDLANTASGSAGVTAGSGNCAIGASNYFGTSNPSGWSPRTTTSINKPLGSITSGSAGSAGGTTVATNIYGSAGSAGGYVNQLLALLNKIIADFKQLSSSITLSTPIVGSNNTTNTTNTTIPNSSDPNYYALGDLVTDKTSYCVGDTPRYTLTGGPGLAGYKILWTSYFNNVITKEIDADYGFKLASNGTGSSWTAYGSTWDSSNIGNWEKVANVGGGLKRASFTVKSCNAPTVTVTTCSPKMQRRGTFSVASWTGSGAGPTYDWVAPGSTKVFGSGSNFGTSYAVLGTYYVTVLSNGKSDTCSIVIDQQNAP